jgi:hypothetical protein
LVDYSDLWKSGGGAIIGFFLAQFVNFATLFWTWWNRPKLVIEIINDKNHLLSHTAQVSAEETADETYYGFAVRNVGRSIATGVRFQILSIEFKDNGEEKYHHFKDTAIDIAVYVNAESEEGATSITLVPQAAARIAVAWNNEARGVLMPCAKHVPDYWDENCEMADEFIFHVVVFDDGGNFVTGAIKAKT